MHQHRGADDLAGGVGDDPQHPGLVAGAAYGHGEEVLERLPLADRPLEEGVLDDVPDGLVVVRGRRADGVARRQRRAAGTVAPSGSWSTQLVQRTSVAERLEQPVAVGALAGPARRSRCSPCAAGGAPRSQRARAVPMPRRRYVGEHAGVAAAGRRSLGVTRPGASPSKTPDRHGGEVEAGPLPVGHEVGRSRRRPRPMSCCCWAAATAKTASRSSAVDGGGPVQAGGRGPCAALNPASAARAHLKYAAARPGLPGGPSRQAARAGTGQAFWIAETSNSSLIFSETSTPPVSSAAFQVRPQSLRLIAVLPSKPTRRLPKGSLAEPVCSNVDGDRLGDALDGQVAGDDPVVASSRSTLGGDEGDLGVVLDVEEVGGDQVAVAVGVAGVDAGGAGWSPRPWRRRGSRCRCARCPRSP